MTGSRVSVQYPSAEAMPDSSRVPAQLFQTGDKHYLDQARVKNKREMKGAKCISVIMPYSFLPLSLRDSNREHKHVARMLLQLLMKVLGENGCAFKPILVVFWW